MQTVLNLITNTAQRKLETLQVCTCFRQFKHFNRVESFLGMNFGTIVTANCTCGKIVFVVRALENAHARNMFLLAWVPRTYTLSVVGKILILKTIFVKHLMINRYQISRHWGIMIPIPIPEYPDRKMMRCWLDLFSTYYLEIFGWSPHAAFWLLDLSSGYGYSTSGYSIVMTPCNTYVTKRIQIPPPPM